MGDIINILCATDDNYVPWCGIMLTSLFKNNSESRFRVFVLTDKMSEANVADMEALAGSYGQSIHIVRVDPAALRDCPIRAKDHVSLATWYRLLAPVLLPEDVSKILYLDCDVVIDGPVRELWNEDLSDVAVAAVIDEDYLGLPKYERLGLDPHKRYFNAGVLLLNMEYWREHGVMERCFRCVSAMPEKLLLHDQDTLNVVLQDEVRLLAVKYNFQTGFLYAGTAMEVSVAMEVRRTVNSPVVIHFTGKRKPWLAHYYHPYVQKFLYYRSISLWKDYPLVYILKEEWRYWRHRFKFAMGWKRRPYITDRKNKK